MEDNRLKNTITTLPNSRLTRHKRNPRIIQQTVVAFIKNTQTVGGI